LKIGAALISVLNNPNLLNDYAYDQDND